MVERHGLDDSDDTGSVCWVKADLRVPSEAIAGAEKVGFHSVGLALNSGGPVRLLMHHSALSGLMHVVYGYQSRLLSKPPG